MARSRNIRRFVIVSVISASLLALVTVLWAVGNSDAVIRYWMMRRLCSESVEKRQVAVNYVVRQIVGEDPDNPRDENDPQRLATLARARQMLEAADDACFQNIVHALAAAGVWGDNFGDHWVRYLVLRSQQVGETQRTYIAVEIGKLLWRRETVATPPVVATIERLLADEAADVRLNALSAAAAVDVASIRLRLLNIAAQDPEPEIARHARIMLGLLGVGEMPRPESMPAEPPPPADALDVVKRLAELEAMATNSTELPITPDMPYLIRLHAVRVSQLAEPGDLVRVFEAEQPTLRDLAAHVAVQRFTPEPLVPLALELIDGFDNNSRMGGAILAGLLPRNEKLIERLRYRAEHATDWIVKQHMHLGLVMQGEQVAQFDPAMLLLHRSVPPTTVMLALLHTGRLDGLDWLLNPFGQAPVSLPLLLDQFRYEPVLRRYVPQLPQFWIWADPKVQAYQADVIRDWYLLRRPALVFDAQRKIFTTETKTKPK